MERLHYLLLIAAFALAPTALAEEVACISSMDRCTQDFVFSELLMKGQDEAYCCEAGYTMRFDHSDTCLCNKTSDVIACEEGPEQCRGNDTLRVHNRLRNVTQCCPKTYSMHTFHGFLNGTGVDRCMCDTSTSGGSRMETFRNGSVVYIHYAGYHNHPIMPNATSTVMGWIRKQMEHARKIVHDILKSFGQRW
ncbi:hypothetical protein ACOMHN_001379 [Nucella lapillus]